ncbi:hypothetical protein M3P05_01790 [Sansalvadorimonas sp. 2012CJ34-2]|uniref:OTU domain-containing protein n=1 Tax=Parendozoicomonas callyspongiae TaxID=2942213 RepID=A0ABT0PBE2_9GAMM|nr:OTU domain-containing protein [Sansalvadorimonas sp. 2012CJ34-2]MCL6268685.1 hypothetical protein [Sansalvadorimonas sp. 2012CJ34-2]
MLRIVLALSKPLVMLLSFASFANYDEDNCWYKGVTENGRNAAVWSGGTKKNEFRTNFEMLQQLLEEYQSSSPYFIPALISDAYTYILQRAECLTQEEVDWLVSNKDQLEQAAKKTLEDVMAWRVTPFVRLLEKETDKKDLDKELSDSKQQDSEKSSKLFEMLYKGVSECQCPSELEDFLRLRSDSRKTLGHISGDLFSSLQDYIKDRAQELTGRRFGHLNDQEREEYLKSLSDFLRKHRLIKNEIAQDGNCIPSALAYQLNRLSFSKDQYTPSDVRKGISHHYKLLLKKNPQHILVTVLGERGEQKLSEDKSWMEVQPALMLAADYYQYPMVHIYPRNQLPVVETYWPNGQAVVLKNPFERAVIIIHNGYGHYDAAVYRPDSINSQPECKSRKKALNKIEMTGSGSCRNPVDIKYIEKLKTLSTIHSRNVLNVAQTYDVELKSMGEDPLDSSQDVDELPSDTEEDMIVSRGYRSGKSSEQIIKENIESSLEELRKIVGKFHKEKDKNDSPLHIYKLLGKCQDQSTDFLQFLNGFNCGDDVQVVSPENTKDNHGFFNVLSVLLRANGEGLLGQSKHSLLEEINWMKSDEYIWDLMNIMELEQRWMAFFNLPDILTSVYQADDPVWSRPERLWLLAVHLQRKIVVLLPFLEDGRCSGIVYSPMSVPVILESDQLSHIVHSLQTDELPPLLMAYNGSKWQGILPKDMVIPADETINEFSPGSQEEIVQSITTLNQSSLNPELRSVISMRILRKIIKLRHQKKWQEVVSLLADSVDHFPKVFRVFSRYCLAHAYLKMGDRGHFSEQLASIESDVDKHDSYAQMRIIALKHLSRVQLGMNIHYRGSRDLDKIPKHDIRCYIRYLASIYEDVFHDYYKATSCLKWYLDKHRDDWHLALSLNGVINSLKDLRSKDKLRFYMAPILKKLHEIYPWNYKVTIAYAVSCSMSRRWDKGMETLEEAGLDIDKVLETWLSIVLRREQYNNVYDPNRFHFQKARELLKSAHQKTPSLKRMWVWLHTLEPERKKVREVIPYAVELVNSTWGTKHHHGNMLSLLKLYATVRFPYQQDELSRLLRDRYAEKGPLNETALINHYLYLKQYGRALWRADQAVWRWPRDANARVLQARAHFRYRSPRTKKLMEDMEQKFYMSPDRNRSMGMEAEHYYEETKDPVKQFQVLSVINNISPKFVAARDKLIRVGLKAGIRLEELGDIEGASNCFLRSFSCNGYCPDSLISGYKLLFLYGKHKMDTKFWTFLSRFKTYRNSSMQWPKYCRGLEGGDVYINGLSAYERTVRLRASAKGFPVAKPK